MSECCTDPLHNDGQFSSPFSSTRTSGGATGPVYKSARLRSCCDLKNDHQSPTDRTEAYSSFRWSYRSSFGDASLRTGYLQILYSVRSRMVWPRDRYRGSVSHARVKADSIRKYGEKRTGCEGNVRSQSLLQCRKLRIGGTSLPGRVASAEAYGDRNTWVYPALRVI